MSDLLDTERETCDFCEVARDEERDEQFTELHLGDSPQPQRISVTDVGRRLNTERRNKSAQGRVLFEMLVNHPQFEVVGKNVVEEIQTVGGETHWTESKPGEDGVTRFETERQADKVGVSLTVHPEPREVEPVAIVCEECAEMFRDLGQE